MGKLCGGQGPTEEVALPFRTVVDLKECELFLRFDTLCNQPLLEVKSLLAPRPLRAFRFC